MSPLPRVDRLAVGPAARSDPRGGRRSWLAVGLLAALALVLLAQAPGLAHASLRASTPADGESVDAAPEQVSFTFNEQVEATEGAIRVFDGDGQRVDDGVQVHPEPDVVAVGVGDLPDGGYVATFRVTSADGHVIRGATTFRVGTGAALDDDTVASLFADGGSGFVGVVATAVRGIDLGATLVAVGALLAALGATVTTRQRGLALQTAEAAAWTGMVASILTVPLQAMEASGFGLAVLGSWTVLRDVVTSSVGTAALTRVAGLLLVVATAAILAEPSDQRRVSPVAGFAGAALLALGSLALDGHTRTVEPTWLMVTGDLVHVAAAAVWAGGLVVMARVLRTGRRRRATTVDAAGSPATIAGGSGPVGPDLTSDAPAGDRAPEAGAPAPGVSATDQPGVAAIASRGLAPDAVDTAADDARFVATFSGRAAWAMAALVVAGGAMAWALVRQPRALTSTDQGWVLLAKVAVVGVILVVGAYNRWRLVPAVTGAGADERVARRQLRTTVRIEVVALVVVVALTAVLVNLQPAVDEAGIAGPFDTVVGLTEDVDLNLVVDPNRAGANEVHVYLLDRTGRPWADAEDVRMELTQVEQGIGPIERDPRPAGPGHWILAGPDLVVPGRWEITTIVGTDRFTEERVGVEVTVNPG